MSTQFKGIEDRLLTEASSAYIPEGCIADLLLPTAKFALYSGEFGSYGMNHLRIENTIKGGKGKFRFVESIIRSTQDFKIKGHGLEGMVTKEDYANVTDPFKAEDDEQMGLTTLIMLAKEKGLADSLGNTAIITQNTTLSGTSQWNDYVNSEVINVIQTAKKAVRDGSGAVANAAIMEYDVAEVLRYHPQLLDYLGFKDSRPGGLNDQELAKALNVKRVFIADAKYNSAKEGQSDVLTNVWGKNLVFAVIPEKAAKRQISLGYNIRLEGSTPRKVYKQPLFNPPGATAILVEDEFDMLLSNVNAAYLIKNAIA